MNKFTTVIICVLMLFTLISCSSSTENSIEESNVEEVISLDFTDFTKSDSINIRSEFSNARYIQLKLPEGLEIYNFDKIYKSKDFIVVIDVNFSNAITVFDHVGNYKYQIESGEAPNMIFEFGDVTVDEINNYLYVLAENVNAIMGINIVTNERTTIAFEDDFYMHKLEFQRPNFLWLHKSYNNYNNTAKDYALTQYNIETKEIINQYFAKPDELKISFLSTKPLTSFENTMYYAPSYSNNVFLFQQDKVKKITFDNIPNTSTFFGLANYSEFTKRLKDDNLYSFQDSFIETANNYMFYMSKGTKLYTALYDKKQDQGYYTSILYDDYLQLPFIPYLSTSSNALLYVFNDEIIDNYGLHNDTQEVLEEQFPEINDFDQKLILAIYEN